MPLTKPPLHTKVKITIDNSFHRRSSLVWCPESYTIEGSVYYPNSWDEKESIRLICENHSTKFPVISMDSIIKIEEIGVEVNSPPQEVDEPLKIEPKEVFFSIESSKPGNFYRVTRKGNFWTCNCVAGLHSKKCRHIMQAQTQESTEKGTVLA